MEQSGEWLCSQDRWDKSKRNGSHTKRTAKLCNDKKKATSSISSDYKCSNL